MTIMVRSCIRKEDYLSAHSIAVWRERCGEKPQTGPTAWPRYYKEEAEPPDSMRVARPEVEPVRWRNHLDPTLFAHFAAAPSSRAPASETFLAGGRNLRPGGRQLDVPLPRLGGPFCLAYFLVYFFRRFRRLS